MYARRSDSGWSVETVDREGKVGGHERIALDKNGYAHIAYYDDEHLVKYARWLGSSWQLETVASTGNCGNLFRPHLDMALDSNGRPHICYYHEIDSDLRYARWTGKLKSG